MPDSVRSRAAALFDQGIALANEGRLREAAEAFAQAQSLLPHPTVEANLQKVEAARKAQAAEAFDMGVKAANAGDLRTASQRFVEAEDLIPHPTTQANLRKVEAARVNQHKAGQAFDQGTAAFKSGRLNDALKFYGQADQFSPHPTTQHNLSVVKRELDAAKRLGIQGDPEQVTAEAVPDPDTLRMMMAALQSRGGQ